MHYRWDNYQALITVPATDENFKSSLKNAIYDELSEARFQMEKSPRGNKARLTAINREIKKRQKEDKNDVR